jgi:hypothetical protein
VPSQGRAAMQTDGPGTRNRCACRSESRSRAGKDARAEDGRSLIAADNSVVMSGRANKIVGRSIAQACVRCESARPARVECEERAR